MTKRKIIIVKPDAAKSRPAAASKKAADPERRMTNNVKNWITERRENRRSEQDSNDRTVVDWSNLPDTSGKPA